MAEAISQSSEPALAPLERLQILERAALAVTAAEIELFDILVVHEALGAAVEHDLAAFHDVAVVGGPQRHVGVLLDQQNRYSEIAIEPANDREHLAHEQRRKPHRR